MEHSFEGKTAVITGGTSGIGKAVAQQLARASARVVVVGQDEEKGRRVEESLLEINEASKFVRANISNESEVESLFETTRELFGNADLLFNNAGREGIMAPVTDFPSEVCEELTQVNIKGTFLCVKYALPQMLDKGEGAIVNTASFVGTTVPFPTGMIYGATKAAVLSMTATLAEGYSDKGIRVFAVCPWMTETPMLDRLTGGQQEVRDQLQQVNPSGTFASPEDIAGVVNRMFAEDAAFVPGGAYLVDAGPEVQQVEIPYRVAG